MTELDYLYARILTTTACNARCDYCYEKGTPLMRMDARTAEQTARFITDQLCDFGTANLEWFGGEPTLNPEAADLICRKLQDADIRYRSSIVTNGLLLRSCLTEERIALWNLRRVQVTLDGPEQEHEAAKQFPQGAFDRILDNAQTCADRGLFVKLRLNYGENDAALKELIDALHARFSVSERVHAYIVPLYSCEHSFSRPLMLRALALSKRLTEAGLADPDALFNLRERDSRCFMMTPSGFTIAPDGHLYNCSHNMSAEQCVGSVWNYHADNPIRLAFLRGEPSQECNQCKAYPICKGGCRIGELGLAEMPQCHPYRSILSEILSIKNGFDQTSV